MKGFKTYQGFTRGLDNVLTALTATVVGLDLLFITASVALRPFGMSLATFSEMPRLWQSFLTFLMVGVILKSKGHISVDFLSMKLKGRPLAWLEIILFAWTGVAAVFLVTSSIEAMLALKDFGERTAAEWAFPIWYIYLAQVVGFITLFLAVVELIIDKAIGLARKNTAETAQVEGK